MDNETFIKLFGEKIIEFLEDEYNGLKFKTNKEKYINDRILSIALQLILITKDFNLAKLKIHTHDISNNEIDIPKELKNE